MSNRLRLISVTLTPAFVTDDGENLTPLSVQPITVLAADWPNVVAQFEDAVTQLRAQIESPEAEAD